MHVFHELGVIAVFSIPTVLKGSSVPQCNSHYALTNDPHGCFQPNISTHTPLNPPP